MIIEAPFSPEQIAALEYWQQTGYYHPFTCPHHHEGSRILKPVESGWKCPCCNYTQDWAHDFMFLSPDQDPVAQTLEKLIKKLKRG